MPRNSGAVRDTAKLCMLSAAAFAVVFAFINAAGEKPALAQGSGNSQLPTPGSRLASDDPIKAALDQLFAHRQVKAPPLDGGSGWINTAGLVDLKRLRGKFVLIDFWTFCCINCMHILPELKKLEQEHRDDLVVIGVHSAKFEAEQDSQNITEAVERYDIEHPVVNDPQQTIWNRYDVHSWPTVVLIDPEGYVIAKTSGEIKADDVDGFLKHAIPYYKAKGLLNETPLHFELVKDHAAPTPLRFPGKILADEKAARLFISDSSHNRIVIADLDGRLQGVVGSGVQGSSDGDFATAQFNRPQGMALRDDALYVADTENHLIRKIDLRQKRVSTIAGTGRQAKNGFPGWQAPDGPLPNRYAGQPRATAISSPWDLWIDGDNLFIAMAGTHQIWKMPLDESEIALYAGNSREDIVDGPPVPRQPYQQGFASFAQPSGLTSDGKSLFVADSEGSSIRAVPLKKGEVKTVVGTAALASARLFTFGDRDGEGGSARLQHPLGVCWHDGVIYVADTYNNKIKRLDPLKHTVTTLAGVGTAGHADGPADKATFSEPAGISFAAGKLYVADTNSHAIRVIALADPPQVSTLTIAGLTPPAAVTAAPTRPKFESAEKITIPTARVRPVDGQIELAVKIALPEGFHINDIAPMRYWLDAPGAGPIDCAGFDKPHKLDKPSAEFTVRVPVKQTSGSDTLTLSMNYYYCQAGADGVCKIGSVVWTAPIELDPAAKAGPVALSVTAAK